MKQHLCKDCRTEVPEPKTVRRLVEKSGGRCATHWRKEKERRKKANHERHVERTYSLPPGVYDELYDFQGGRCAFCQRATGASKKLAVDHDHSCCPGPVSCGNCVRGLLCGPCNQFMGHVRDNPEMLRRGARYLQLPPFRAMRLRRDLREQQGTPRGKGEGRPDPA